MLLYNDNDLKGDTGEIYVKAVGKPQCLLTQSFKLTDLYTKRISAIAKDSVCLQMKLSVPCVSFACQKRLLVHCQSLVEPPLRSRFTFKVFCSTLTLKKQLGYIRIVYIVTIHVLIYLPVVINTVQPVIVQLPCVFRFTIKNTCFHFQCLFSTFCCSFNLWCTLQALTLRRDSMVSHTP